MAIGTREEELVSLKPARQAPSRVGLRRLLGRDWATAWLFLAPCLLVLVGLIAYPFVSAILLSFNHARRHPADLAVASAAAQQVA